jgi:AbrB family looped-hinge helix DNA binding protein
MSRVTSKLQVTIPKAIAEMYRIRPGDEVRWEVREPGPMMVPGSRVRSQLTPEERVAQFRRETERVRRLQAGRKWPRARDRGWTREELYGDIRGLPR